MARLIGFRVLLCATIAIVCALSAAQAKTLRLVTDLYANSPDNRGDANMPGFSVEVTKQVFAVIGQDVSFEFLPPVRAWSTIVRGERDGILEALRTSERERICSFPDEPMSRGRSVLFVRTVDAGKLKFSSFDDLVGHDVAAVETRLPGFLEYPGLSPALAKFLVEHYNIVETKGNIESLRMLAAGRVDYAVMTPFDGMNDISELGLSGTMEPILSHSVIEQDAGVCFAKRRVSLELVAAFSRALKQLKQTEAYQAIRRKYLKNFGPASSTPSPGR